MAKRKKDNKAETSPETVDESVDESVVEVAEEPVEEPTQNQITLRSDDLDDYFVNIEYSLGERTFTYADGEKFEGEVILSMRSSLRVVAAWCAEQLWVKRGNAIRNAKPDKRSNPRPSVDDIAELQRKHIRRSKDDSGIYRFRSQDAKFFVMPSSKDEQISELIESHGGDIAAAIKALQERLDAEKTS